MFNSYFFYLPIRVPLFFSWSVIAFLKGERRRCSATNLLLRPSFLLLLFLLLAKLLCHLLSLVSGTGQEPAACNLDICGMWGGGSFQKRRRRMRGRPIKCKVRVQFSSQNFNVRQFFIRIHIEWWWWYFCLSYLFFLQWTSERKYPPFFFVEDSHTFFRGL